MAKKKPHRSVPVAVLFMAGVLLPALYLTVSLKMAADVGAGPPSAPKPALDSASALVEPPPADPARAAAFAEVSSRKRALEHALHLATAVEERHLRTPVADPAYWHAEAEQLGERRRSAERDLAAVMTEFERYRCPDGVPFRADCWR